MSKQLFVDKWGITWVRVDEINVWNRNAGYGLWDNGKGLRAL